MKIKIIITSVIFFGLGLFLISQYGFETKTVAEWSPDSDLGKDDPGRSTKNGTVRRGSLSRRTSDAANKLAEEWSLSGPPQNRTMVAAENAKALSGFVLDHGSEGLAFALALADPQINGDAYAHCAPQYAPEHGSCHMSITTVYVEGENDNLVVNYSRADVHGEEESCKQYAACLARETVGREVPGVGLTSPFGTTQTFTAGPWANRMEKSRDKLTACIDMYSEQVVEAELLSDDPPADMPDFEFVAGLMKMQLKYCEDALAELEGDS